MKRLLITGGRGFIGSAVVDFAQSMGWTVDTFDLPNDVRDADAVAKAVKGHDHVIHLAGVLGTHELFDTIDLAIDVNIKGTTNVLEACRKHSATYTGITMPQVFPSVYTATKVAATRLASAFHHTYELPVSHVRAFNAFGAGQKHGPGHPQKIVPTFAVAAWAGTPMPIWGDGTQTVDLIHATDLARVLLYATRLGGDVTLDGGTGEAFTVNEVAFMAAKVAGTTPLIQYLPMRRGELPTNIVAEAPVPGCEFRWSDFVRTVESYRDHPLAVAA